MADPVEGDELSLVPYSTRDSKEIFLRHDNAVVVYDEKLKQLVLRGAPASSTADKAMALAKCPVCKRPIRADSSERHEDRAVSHHDVEAGFVNPNYFRMLQNVSPRSPDISRPPTPQDTWESPVNVGRGPPSLAPSVDADFIEENAPASPSTTQGISSAAFSPNYFKRFFVEEGELGRGGKGVVLLVKHVLDGVFLGHFACKRVPVGDDHAWLEKVLIEVQLLQNLSHQNLVSYRHVWLENVKLTKFGPSVPCAFILQQYCNAGDLHRFVYQPVQPTTKEQLKGRMRRRSKGELEQPKDMHSPRRLSFDEIYSFFKDIASGLAYLHGNGFIHRDLKPSNCLLHDTGKGMRVLVSDFGEAQMESAARRSTGTTGTISYCAPEVLRPQYPSGPLGEFSAKSDIFSLGMILYFMCFARLPYANADNLNEDKEDLDRLKDEISQWPGFEDVARDRSDLPDKLYKFLSRLLALDPADRPTAEEILRGISTGSALSDFSLHHPNHHPKNRSLGVDAAGPGPTVFDDVRSGSRISPVDSPRPSTPAGGGVGVGAGRWRGPKRPSASDDLEGPARAATESSLVLRGSFPPTTPSRMRSTPITPVTPTRTDSPRSQSFSPTQPSPRTPGPAGLLQDAPGTSWSFRPILTRPGILRLLRSIPFITALFAFKIFSMTRPCSPLAPNSWVLYPLVCLGALDFATHTASWSFIFDGGAPSDNLRDCQCLRSFGFSVVLLFAHFIVLAFVRRAGVLCCRNIGVNGSDVVVMVPADDY